MFVRMTYEREYYKTLGIVDSCKSARVGESNPIEGKFKQAKTVYGPNRIHTPD